MTGRTPLSASCRRFHSIPTRTTCIWRARRGPFRSPAGELAVRAALGAGRGGLIRQLVVESVLTSLAGAALGLGVAALSLRLLVQFAARFTTRAAEVNLNVTVLLFTLGIAVATGVIFGLLPALSFEKN